MKTEAQRSGDLPTVTQVGWVSNLSICFPLAKCILTSMLVPSWHYGNRTLLGGGEKVLFCSVTHPVAHPRGPWGAWGQNAPSNECELVLSHLDPQLTPQRCSRGLRTHRVFGPYGSDDHSSLLMPQWEDRWLSHPRVAHGHGRCGFSSISWPSPKQW